MKITNYDNSVEDFDINKLQDSIKAANSEEILESAIESIAKDIQEELKITENKISELVIKKLEQTGYTRTKQKFKKNRINKQHLRQDKSSLGIKDDIGLPYYTLLILKKRYLLKDENGNTIESPLEMIERVAKCLSDVEESETDKQYWYQKFYHTMSKFEFLPGTRTLANAGKPNPQLSNCFVWPIEDDIDYLFGILHKSTLIKKHGGGCGYNFSKIRPKGDSVGGEPGLSAGPVKMIQMYDLMTSIFKQQGRYESGNMAVLNIDHPDILNFINSKTVDGVLSKTNISVGITDDFMEAVRGNKQWDLINPRTKKVERTINASVIFDRICELAHKTGDPGIINLSAINRGTAFANPLLEKRGPIEATNPCGEVPLYPYESCNLGYVNLTKFVDETERTFDLERLKNTINVATRMLDNVIDASWFPVREVTESVKNHRRLGIGCVGFAETLTKLGIEYGSQESIEFAEQVSKKIYESAFEASCDIAKVKGPFPFVHDSIWADSNKKPRNVALITYPPSSGNAVICNTSFGIEPFFALAYEHNIMNGNKIYRVNELLTKVLKDNDIYSDELISKISNNHGSIEGINEIPEHIRRVFKVAHDINWKNHIKIQAAFQKYTDNAITKTINMPSSVNVEDIKQAYMMAYDLGCKGLTIYRDQTKSDQVFTFGDSSTKTEIKK